MTVIVARQPQGRAFDSDSFTDLTDAAVKVEWVDGIRVRVTLTPDVSPEVAAAVRCRVISQDAADEALRSELRTALALPKDTTARRLVRLEALLDAVAQLLLNT